MARTSHKRRSPKKRSQTYAQLKRALDKVFSEYIRRRGSENGLAQCITCNAVLDWKRIQCGHFVSRVHLATRWDQRNAAPQCMACNVWRRGAMADYSLWITKQYGPGIIQELVDKKRSPVKYTRSDLQEMIQTYKTALANIAKP